MLQTFLPLFIMTFGICLFIVLMQFLWRSIDDLVGKGLGISVLAEMFFYAALFLVPMALPLSLLLASLMTFGNLGERLELLAMKSAGVSLIHIMRPLIILIAGVSIGAFFFQNNVMPVVNVKLYALLYSMRQKSPELEIPEGVFFKDIPKYTIYVKKKDPDGLFRDMMIYDYSDGFDKAMVIVADSARLKTSADKLFLVLSLYNGEAFQNLQPSSSTRKQGGDAMDPYRRESFQTKEILIEFDANFTRRDDSFLQNQYLGKNLEGLQSSIDSMTVRLDSIKALNAKSLYDNSYKKNLHYWQEQAKVEEDTDPVASSSNVARVQPPASMTLNYDSLYQAQLPSAKAALLTRVKVAAEYVKQDYHFRALTLGDEAARVRRHYTEWHKKLTLSFACLVFFFIGAPLGAIIRKGGLGVPVIISVLLYIFYYIVDNIGFKMARDGVWEAWQGMWLSSAVLTPMGIFLTYKAVNDSVILNADTYLNILKNLIGKRSGRKIEMKEVIIYAPDYATLIPQLTDLKSQCTDYLKTHKRWVNYFTYWKDGGKDVTVQRMAVHIEAIVEELSNSDQILILNKLMDYPVISGYNQLSMHMNKKVGLILAFFFPIGIPLYFLAIYQRGLLQHDMKAVQRTTNELLEMIQTS